MPPDLKPAELALLVDYSERARAGDWSLRSALVRYAQSEPERVSRVLELVRRIEAAMHPLTKVLAAEGPELWQHAIAGTTPTAEPAAIVAGMLGAMVELDRLAELLVAFAVDRTGPRPDAEVDRVVEDVTRRLDALGVAREERGARPRGRG